MADEIFDIILKDTYSLSQLKHRLRILKSNLLKTFFGSESENIPLSAQDLDFLKSLPENFYEKFNKDNVYQKFTELDQKINTLDILTMYLPFETDEATVNQISLFARKTFRPTLILDIKLDPNLIAGTSLVWKGIMRDYSLRAKIQEKKGEILQGFKRFLK